MTRKKSFPLSTAGDPQISKLEIVLKCDVTGTVEAVSSSLANLNIPDVDIHIIQSGVGNITKSDVLMAQTGSRLAIGFNVDTMPKLDQQVGIKISDWKKARVDDLVECFEIVQLKGGGPWRPRSRIFRSKA